MCKYFTLLFIAASSALQAQIQHSLHLKPNATQGKDALVLDHTTFTTTNFGTNQQLYYVAGTAGGINNFGRGFFQFDLSVIPPQATIDSAYLSMYAWNQSSGTGPHSWTTGPNDGWVQRVIEPWDEMVITWANQPKTTTANRMPIDSAQAPGKNYPRIYVTTLVQDMIDTVNCGFMFRLQTEVKYRGVNFCSSDHVDSNKWPEIHIYYSTCLEEDSTTVTICQGDSVLIGNTWRKTVGWYADTIPGSGGCDTIVHTQLTMQSLNVSAIQSGNSIVASGTGSFFIWINCNSGLALTPVTTNVFSPATSGYYAAINIVGNCRDTSNCVEFIPNSIEERDVQGVRIWPTPNSGGLIHIHSKEEMSNLELRNIDGRMVLNKPLQPTSETALNTSGIAPGIYVISISLPSGILRKSLVIE